jgi:cytochrome bd-type quinol oxidase subunit 1
MHFTASTAFALALLIVTAAPNGVNAQTGATPMAPPAVQAVAASGAGRNPETKVVGLEDFQRDQWPNVRLVHWSFDIMVGAGSVMFAVAAWVAWIWWRTRRLPDNKWLLRALVCCAPLGSRPNSGGNPGSSMGLCARAMR